MGVQEREKKGREVAVLNSLDAGELRGYYGTTRDISQSKRLREKPAGKGQEILFPFPSVAPDLRPGVNTMCGLSYSLVLFIFFSFRVFLQGFPTPQKLTILNSNSIWKVSPFRWGQFQRFDRLISSHT